METYKSCWTSCIKQVQQMLKAPPAAMCTAAGDDSYGAFDDVLEQLTRQPDHPPAAFEKLVHENKVKFCHAQACSVDPALTHCVASSEWGMP
jgi:hypothetical protein